MFVPKEYKRWRSIRNKSLRKLLFLMWHVESEDGTIHQNIDTIRQNLTKRESRSMIKDTMLARMEIDADVMSVLDCSLRTAFDYRETMLGIHALLKSRKRE